MAQQTVTLTFERTVCDCNDCKECCRHMSGVLHPDDLKPMMELLGHTSLLAFARENLMASPGAIALDRTTGRRINIPTLVPARKEDGRCIFLNDKEQCMIHAVAPFGCAFFDTHMGMREGDRRSNYLHTSIQNAHKYNTEYAYVWRKLKQMGRMVPGPEVCRERMQIKGPTPGL